MLIQCYVFRTPAFSNVNNSAIRASGTAVRVHLNPLRCKSDGLRFDTSEVQARS